MDLVAEGVETFDQVTYLRDRGIKAAQGYVFAPPLPSSSFLQLLDAMDPVAEAAAADAAQPAAAPPKAEPAQTAPAQAAPAKLAPAKATPAQAAKPMPANLAAKIAAISAKAPPARPARAAAAG